MHPNRRLNGRILLSLSTLAMAGCLESGQDGARRGAFDADFNADSLPLLTLVEEIRIGSTDDPHYGFSRIGGAMPRAAVDREGNVYIYEQAAREIRVYSPDGALLRRLGGPGDGPGEFQSMSNLGIGSVGIGVMGDTVWAMDWLPPRAGRLTLFHREGGAISTRQVHHLPVGPPEGRAVLGPVWMSEDGLFTANLQPFTVGPFSPAVLTAPVEVPIVRFSAEGEVVDTVGSYRFLAPAESRRLQVGQGEYTLPRPADSEPLFLLLPDGAIIVERPIAEIGRKGIFVVSRRGFAGDILYRRTFSYDPVSYTDSILQRSAGLASRPGPGSTSTSPTGELIRRPDRLPQDSARAHETIFKEMNFPPFQPPISGTSGLGPIFVGEDGTLWLRREDGRTNEGRDRWLGLDPEGSPIGALHLEDQQIVWSRERTIWIVEFDELRVPWLVRYRLEG